MRPSGKGGVQRAHGVPDRNPDGDRDSPEIPGAHGTRGDPTDFLHVSAQRVGGVLVEDLHAVATCTPLAISSRTNVRWCRSSWGHRTAVLTPDRYCRLFPDDLDGIADAFGAAAATTAGDLRAVSPRNHSGPLSEGA
ncbi:hypothetical protein M2272_005691 [Mycobacterium frederiksbergense]|uniref:Uncharacterized protein n=1 Tax=Mycolicibacterium frederiksbergense TaxID=117567 RepID=A0ABT6L7Z3_9MYCO|nr:hypothetical protein [Mycolicibacterium frederiksbergense]MDH6199024.1 hypothetical protein [Mycolicibacterium frederiksbergense]